MTPDVVLSVFRTTIWTIFKLSAPLLLVSVLIGLVIAIFQAATQIHEQTLTFVPKLVAIALILLICSAWMITNLQDFFTYLMEIMAGL